MTALRIFATANPSLIGAHVQPMSAEDADFWKRFGERRASRALPVGTRPAGARSAKPIARGDARSAAGAHPHPGPLDRLISKIGRVWK